MIRKKIKLITFLMIISFVVIMSYTTLNNLKTSNEVNNIVFFNENNINDNYAVQQVKMFAVTLNVKGKIDEKIKTTPLTCKINVDRVIRLIYMDGTKEIGEKYVRYKKPVGSLLKPTKEGYDFIKWTDEAGNDFTESSVINENNEYRIYAKWNSIPKVEITNVAYKNSGLSGLEDIHGVFNKGETITVTINASDEEDKMPKLEFVCKSGRLCNTSTITKVSENDNQVVYEIQAKEIGVGLIEVTATDTEKTTATSQTVIYVYGPGGGVYQEAKFTSTTYDSGWIDVLEGCYISNFTFTVQFGSGHSNGTTPQDTMVVYGMTESGKKVELYTWSGNMLSTLHQSTINGLQSQKEKIRQVRFYTYSPHADCAKQAKITYSAKYTFDLSLLDSSYSPNA